MAHMFEDKDSTEHILKFLQTTEVENRMKEKDRKQRDEERDEFEWLDGVNGAPLGRRRRVGDRAR